MGRQFERYRFRDQVTRLDESTFNPIWADLDLRIANLEALQVEWESALAVIADQGLARVAAAMSGPLATLSAEVGELRAQIEAAQQEGMLLDGPGTVSDANLGDRTVDDSVAPAGNTGTLTAVISGLANRIKGITGGANWRANSGTTLAALADAFVASASHIANRSNPHQVTPAQVGAAPVGGSSAQVYAVANATAATHALNRQTGDGRYLRLMGGAAEFDNGNSGSAKTLTLANGSYQKLTLTVDNADITISTSGAPIGQYFLRLVNTSSAIDRVDFVGMAGRWLDQSSESIVPRTGSGAETWVILWWTGSVLVGWYERVGTG